MLQAVRSKRQRSPQILFGEMRVGVEQVGERVACPTFSQDKFSVMRAPLMQGLPIVMSGSEEMRGCDIRSPGSR
jgi:hypothetical protein